MSPSKQPAARGSRTWPRRSRRFASAARDARRCWRNSSAPVRIRSRSPIPTAGPWPRTRTWRSMQARLAQHPEILERRRETVEHPFGTIKQWMNQGAFLMRGLDKVRGEFSLTALAYNLRRVLNLVAFTALMAAVRD